MVFKNVYMVYCYGSTTLITINDKSLCDLLITINDKSLCDLFAHGCYVTSMSLGGNRMALDHSLTHSLTHSILINLFIKPD